ncbi:hypothetical protein AUEXF2481DRAFT_388535 [Aureobasidium subglaciale EXF-2481]|uniref:Inositol-pentakisphosphate 2-kinase n=1 Tax=Aureobasidium subglaciale (strain EXF-2481) TaxID=1043005 RepID=A0A074YMS2_AURSE|nr:uncharacterized protein AUEXF2481DRAFT_388535 [Aureobasidium subglaciale EXF-2481]KAI5205551.1 hypothetical protein E4T38_04202 [Aureobasidium subglaciale]KAI5224628.1 hypothetical protein E4T40_03987 [Aureobasidium subglaciale]KAI5227848.1 hypothetical protein E4T41_04207 [Aureobasidium subglaciale]KAI5263312.1 hypothetical protein E4T46_03828 [Aureobasidium subglaciale]KEQ98995.1 hypothetical protein AUEXF2481DRAFT_388535 [Aureobasidium subglaciale EXF-2481]
MTSVVYSSLPHERISLAEQDGPYKFATLVYLAEGNANIVYSFRPTTNGAVPQSARSRLLRLRKDKSFIQSTKSQFATFQQTFVPLFRPENLVEQELIALDGALIQNLNKELEVHEDTKLRKSLRHGDRLALDKFGLLMTDMTARDGEYLFEIKPKWLLQSPDAPEDSIRCRTCALRLQRAHAKSQGAVMPNSGGFCPLSLVDDDVRERQRAFESIIKSQASGISDASVEKAVSFLAEEGYRVLKDLRKYQAQFDERGILSTSAEEVSDDYSKAMTLRDCVLFIRGSLDAFGDTADIRLADLDFKHTHPDKIKKWMETEKVLVDGGWYKDPEDDEGSEPACLLARRPLGTMQA